MSACMIQEDMLFIAVPTPSLDLKYKYSYIAFNSISDAIYFCLYIPIFFTDFLRIKMFLNHETVLSKGNPMELLRNVNKSFIKYES